MEYVKIMKPTDIVRVMEEIKENTKLKINAVCREKIFVTFESEDPNDFVMLGRIFESARL